MDDGQPPQADNRKKRMVEKLNGKGVTMGVIQGVVIIGLVAVVSMLWSYQGQLGELRSDVGHLQTTVEGLDLGPAPWLVSDVQGLEQRVLDLERIRQDE